MLKDITRVLPLEEGHLGKKHERVWGRSLEPGGGLHGCTHVISHRAVN